MNCVWNKYTFVNVFLPLFQFVDGNYADDLHHAMLLSKLDFEEKKEYYDQIKKASEDEKKGGSKKNKKSNKAQPMSLSQFNQLGDQEPKVGISSAYKLRKWFLNIASL